MSESNRGDGWEKSRYGKKADGEEPCPICGDSVRKIELPDHIRDEHGGDSDFPAEP